MSPSRDASGFILFRRGRRTASAFLLSLLGLALLAPPAPLRADGVFDAIGDEVNKVFEGAKGSIVRVRAQQHDFETTGTGFFVDNKGTIVTAAAILGPSGDVSVETPGTDGQSGVALPAKIVGVDLRSGVAVLQVFNGKTPFLPLAASSDPKTAMPVVGIGYPFNLPPAPAFGMVTGFDTRYLNRFFATTHLRTSLAISPGQIGGPVLDGRGGVVGMIVMAADERKFTYVLPTSAIQKILSDLTLHGRVEHGWVGVGIDPNSDSKEVRITQLFKGTPAAGSGLQPGDVVVRIDRREIVQPSDVIDASFFSRVGMPMSVVVAREGKLMTFSFTVGERPSQLPVPESVRDPSKVDPAAPLAVPVSTGN